MALGSRSLYAAIALGWVLGAAGASLMFAASAASLMFAASAASLMFAVSAALAQDAEPPEPPLTVAVLQGLDKVTARISTISAPINDTVRFGSLRITARTCTKTPPTEPPEVAAFLEVTEAQPGELPKPVFSGWMFASSPALSAMEHPVYDVWVIDCRAARIVLPGVAAPNP